MLLIIVAVVGLALLVGLGVGIYLIVTSSREKAGAMACGACGYAVEGLTQPHCPECGADLREAGIRPAGTKDRHTLGLVLVLTCIVLLTIYCGLSGLFFGAA